MIKAIKRDIMQFAGSWKTVSNEDLEKIKRNVSFLRKKSTKELLKNITLE